MNCCCNLLSSIWRVMLYCMEKSHVSSASEGTRLALAVMCTNAARIHGSGSGVGCARRAREERGRLANRGCRL